MFPGRHAPDRIAYVMANSGTAVTYGELEADSNRAAHLFRGNGLNPGQGIALLLDNGPDYLKIVWGAQRAGLYFTPVSVLFQQGEIDYILTNSDASVLITATRFLDRVSPHVLDRLTVYLVDADSPFPGWRDALAAMPSERIRDECEGAEMIYSSGTTGRPKGVRFPLDGLRLGSVPALIEARVRAHEIDEHVRYLSTAPLYHSAPLRYNLMVTRYGGTCTIMEKFDAEQALRLIERDAITHSQWVPTMFIRLLRLPDAVRSAYNLSSLRFVIHAAAPCPVDVKRQMIDWLGPKLYEYYSGTEANGSTAINSDEWLAHPGSVGRPIHGTLHIADEDGNELGPGETGTVWFEGGTTFSYYKDPDKTAAAYNEHGWSTLGDMGYVDDDGYLYLKDRKSFMIISGGVNIYPAEVEACLQGHPGVADVAVFGVPNAEFGEEVKAVVEPDDPGLATPALEAELIEWCRARISHVKCPRSVDFINQLPRHPTGKLYKRELQQRYLSAPS